MRSPLFASQHIAAFSYPQICDSVSQQSRSANQSSMLIRLWHLRGLLFHLGTGGNSLLQQRLLLWRSIIELQKGGEQLDGRTLGHPNYRRAGQSPSLYLVFSDPFSPAAILQRECILGGDLSARAPKWRIAICKPSMAVARYGPLGNAVVSLMLMAVRTRQGTIDGSAHSHPDSRRVDPPGLRTDRLDYLDSKVPTSRIASASISSVLNAAACHFTELNVFTLRISHFTWCQSEREGQRGRRYAMSVGTTHKPLTYL
jgi:hypothetical protein